MPEPKAIDPTARAKAWEAQVKEAAWMYRAPRAQARAAASEEQAALAGDRTDPVGSSLSSSLKTRSKGGLSPLTE